MTYKEVIQALWDNQIKPRDERKDYVIKNISYSPYDVTDVDRWGDSKPAEWDHFGIGFLGDNGFFKVIDIDFNIYYDDPFDNFVLFAYSDLNNPAPLPIRLIESEEWELIERSNNEI